MGWLFFNNYTRSDLINYLVKREENNERIYETLKHSLRGNALWTVRRVSQKNTDKAITFIGCDLLQRSVEKHSNRNVVSWGYKDMDESVHPLYYSCPMSYLKDVPVACQEWRDGVMKYNRKFDIGDKVILRGCEIPHLEVISIRPLLGTYQGTRYRIPRKLIADAETVAARQFSLPTGDIIPLG